MFRMSSTLSHLFPMPFYSSECFTLVCSHCACECADTEEGQYPLSGPELPVRLIRFWPYHIWTVAN